MSQITYITGQNVLLPGFNVPRPATIKIDVGTGKITDILDIYLTRSGLSADKDATWLDAGEKYILPGLVE